MIHWMKTAVGAAATLLLIGGTVQGDEIEARSRALTHSDAAIILAKYSGYFNRYVDPDAGLNECVVFLNKTGIYFGLMEILNETEFTHEDCARAMGQIDLVLSGEALYSHGKVKLPKGIETWEEFCSMHGVNYAAAHQMMLKMVNSGGTRSK
jgi:hypothetical protein